MTVQYFRVSADHVNPKYECKGKIALVSEDHYAPSVEGHSMTYSAVIPGYGYGKYYHTPRDAITCMLLEHGCTNIRIEPVTLNLKPQ